MGIMPLKTNTVNSIKLGISFLVKVTLSLTVDVPLIRSFFANNPDGLASFISIAAVTLVSMGIIHCEISRFISI